MDPRKLWTIAVLSVAGCATISTTPAVSGATRNATVDPNAAQRYDIAAVALGAVCALVGVAAAVALSDGDRDWRASLSALVFGGVAATLGIYGMAATRPGGAVGVEVRSARLEAAATLTGAGILAMGSGLLDLLAADVIGRARDDAELEYPPTILERLTQPPSE